MTMTSPRVITGRGPHDVLREGFGFALPRFIRIGSRGYWTSRMASIMATQASSTRSRVQ